mmetsp:Transcript_18063/g.50107  ORF Transcript_18063/g.50107 Transcript_18063/m.50107 type:complete len:234 (-) Transcript_18063:52-753(-)
MEPQQPMSQIHTMGDLDEILRQHQPIIIVVLCRVPVDQLDHLPQFLLRQVLIQLLCNAFEIFQHDHALPITIKQLKCTLRLVLLQALGGDEWQEHVERDDLIVIVGRAEECFGNVIRCKRDPQTFHAFASSADGEATVFSGTSRMVEDISNLLARLFSDQLLGRWRSPLRGFLLPPPFARGRYVVSLSSERCGRWILLRGCHGCTCADDWCATISYCWSVVIHKYEDATWPRL